MISLISLIALAQMASAASELPLGSAIQVVSTEEASPCPIKITVPSAVANAECNILFTSFSDDASRPFPQKMDFYFSEGTFEASDATKQAYIPDTDFKQVKVKCTKAGTYYLGSKVNDCSGVCNAAATARNPESTISAVIMPSATSYRIDVPEAMQGGFKIAPILLKERESVYIYWETKAVDQVAHFDFDKCGIKCKFDDFEYTWGAADAADDTLEKVSSGTNNIVKIKAPAAGVHKLRVTLAGAVTGKTSTIQADFALNMDSEDLDYPVARCPQEDCSADDYAACDKCTPEGCNWCDGKCTNGLCEGMIEAADKCPKIDCEVSSCGECAAIDGCAWCATVGITGTCSRGKSDLGKECKSPLATAVVEADKCDASTTMIATTLFGLIGLSLF